MSAQERAVGAEVEERAVERFALLGTRTLDDADREVHIIPPCRCAELPGRGSGDIDSLVPVALIRQPPGRAAAADDTAERQFTRIGRDEGFWEEHKTRATSGRFVREARSLGDGRRTIEQDREVVSAAEHASTAAAASRCIPGVTCMWCPL